MPELHDPICASLGRQGSAPDVFGQTYLGVGGLRSGYGQGESVSTDTATRLMRSGARRSSPWTGPTGRPAPRKWNEPKIPDYAKREAKSGPSVRDNVYSYCNLNRMTMNRRDSSRWIRNRAEVLRDSLDFSSSERNSFGSFTGVWSISTITSPGLISFSAE